MYKGKVASPWDEVVIALIQVATNALDGDPQEAYREQAHLVKYVVSSFDSIPCTHTFDCSSPWPYSSLHSQFFRFFITQSAWVLPALNDVLKTLRELAAEVRPQTLSTNHASILFSALCSSIPF